MSVVIGALASRAVIITGMRAGRSPAEPGYSCAEQNPPCVERVARRAWLSLYLGT